MVPVGGDSLRWDVEDDLHWLPLLLDGKDFDGSFYFNGDASRLLDFKLTTS